VEGIRDPALHLVPTPRRSGRSTTASKTPSNGISKNLLSWLTSTKTVLPPLFPPPLSLSPSSLFPPLLMNSLLWKPGPVEACFEVYQDFMSYTSGVYVRKSDSDLGGHCIKIIGWGVTATGVKVRTSFYPVKYNFSCYSLISIGYAPIHGVPLGA